jgi:hypothetical protein
MRPTECYACDQQIGPSDLVCSNCEAELDDSVCSYCDAGYRVDDLGGKNNSGYCIDCFIDSFFEMSAVEDIPEQLLSEMGLTIKDLPKHLRESYEQHIAEQEAERQYEAELDK